MSDLLTALHFALPDAAGVPDWVHLVPSGRFAGVDGRGPYRVENADAVIAASMAGGKLAIDENHSTDVALTKGGAAPARGWVAEMQARPDGIWGRVDWTASGAALLGDKAYRGLSPVFNYEPGGKVVRVIRVGLTNAPNLSLTALHTQQGTGMDLDTLRSALGLGADAGEDQVLAAIKANREAVAAHSQTLGRVAKLAGVASRGLDAEEILVALQTRTAIAGEAGAMAGELVALQTQLAEVRSERAREKAEAAVRGAMKAGKPIARSMVDYYIARHTQDPAGVERELAAMPSLGDGGLAEHRPEEGGGDTLSQAERKMVQMFGVDPAGFVKTRNARLAGGG